jgi:hypothetical protein
MKEQIQADWCHPGVVSILPYNLMGKLPEGWNVCPQDEVWVKE